MSESKECHMNNNDILTNCLKIITCSTRKIHRPSSHGDAYYVNRNRVDNNNMKVISAPIDSAEYFDELLKGGH